MVKALVQLALGEQGWLGRAAGCWVCCCFPLSPLDEVRLLLVKVFCEAFRIRVFLSFLFYTRYER